MEELSHKKTELSTCVIYKVDNNTVNFYKTKKNQTRKFDSLLFTEQTSHSCSSSEFSLSLYLTDYQDF